MRRNCHYPFQNWIDGSLILPGAYAHSNDLSDITGKLWLSKLLRERLYRAWHTPWLGYLADVHLFLDAQAWRCGGDSIFRLAIPNTVGRDRVGTSVRGFREGCTG
jgi:hypothetical protein